MPKVVCVSNRLPVSAHEDSGILEFHPSAGGLVTANAPVLRKSRGLWIGWPGTVDSSTEQVNRALAEFSSQSEFEIVGVPLDKNALTGFYQGFSNQIIWPLFHDLQSRCNFEPEFWSTYLKVQEMYRDIIVRHVQPDDLVWVHDYQLMGLGRAVRLGGLRNKLCFFLHIPFPCPDIFLKLPWRTDVVESLLNYDLLGFQTARDLKNFIDCVEVITSHRHSRRGSLAAVKINGRECLAGKFPISIDFNEFEQRAQLPEIEERLRTIRADMNVQFLVLSIDRLDYTKGIPYRIRAFRRLLELDSTLKRRVALLQVVVPSRVEVPEYQLLRQEIEQMVAELNGTHAEPGWVPVHHLFRSLAPEDVVAMYRASDVALVTPLKDGMNLVAKEYCASRINNGGVLILSEFVGAAEEFHEHAILVNPYDIDGVARALLRAFEIMDAEAREKMRCLREIVRSCDVFAWASSFLKAAGWGWPSSDVPPRPNTVWERLRSLTRVFDI